MFEADGKPQQVLRSLGIRTFAGCAMLDQTFGAAKRSSAREQLNARDYLHCGIATTLHPDRHHTPESGHLLLGDRVAGIALQPRIVDARKCSITFEDGSVG